MHSYIKHLGNKIFALRADSACILLIGLHNLIVINETLRCETPRLALNHPIGESPIPILGVMHAGVHRETLSLTVMNEILRCETPSLAVMNDISHCEMPSLTVNQPIGESPIPSLTLMPALRPFHSPQIQRPRWFGPNVLSKGGPSGQVPSARQRTIGSSPRLR
jgi:hypothetical protein